MQRFRLASGQYPSQFWLIFWGLLISAIGGSMIWPFLMIYVSEKLSLPLTTIASLMTINAAMGLLFAFVAGPVTDRFGRKWVMVISLAINGVGYLLMSRASTLLEFALLMALSGAFNPLYRVGADAMLADLVPPEKRIDAYSWLRMSNNIGVALGPAIGGFIASSSYTYAFYIAAASFLIYCLLVIFRARETLPQPSAAQTIRPIENFAGYGRVLSDRPFISFVAAFTLVQMCASLVWVLMGVYAKRSFGVAENQFGLIPTTNAIMVVLLQVWVTAISKRFTPLRTLGFGSLFYAIGTGLVAFSGGFWGFWIAMVIVTIGELTLVPTSNTYAANLAPAEMRGRYMSIYGLTWGVSIGIAPVIGGMLSDNLGPRYTWYGGFLVGMVAVAAFFFLARRFPHPPDPAAAPSAGD
ncbi:MAG: MFS transporter [Anaerolineaceae bacterium]|nr:MFS transporter [Anaerolineaceae bacterium]